MLLEKRNGWTAGWELAKVLSLPTRADRRSAIDGSIGHAQFETADRDATPALILLLVLLSLVPPLLVVPGLGGAGRPAALLGLTFLGWWLLTRLLPQSQPHQFVAIRWVVFIELLTFGASMVVAIDRGLVGVEARQMDRALLLALSSAGVVLVLIDGLQSRASIERILRWAVGFGVVGAAVGIVQFLGFDLVPHIKIPGLVENRDRAGIGSRGAADFARVRGFARHPIEFGVVLAALLPIALHFAMEPGRSGWKRWVSPLVLAAAIPMSISRSGVIALVLGLAIFSTGWAWRQRANFAAVAIVMVVAFQAAIPGLLGTIRSLFKNIGTDNSISGRTEDFGATAVFIEERPWLGRGPGTFVIERYRVLDNEYLGTLLERGWIGVGSLVLLLGCSGLTALWLVRNSRSARVRSLSRAIGANFVVAFVVFAMFDALAFPIYSGLLFVMIGCLGGLYRFEKIEQSEARANHASIPVGLDRS